MEHPTQNLNELDDNVKAHIILLSEVYNDVTDWLEVKKKLMLLMSPKDRKNFSTRDEKTKKHFPFNDYEKNVRKFWKEITGKTLEMPEDKRLDDIDPVLYL